MAKNSKQDFRDILNLLLSIYYHKKDAFFIHQTLAQENTAIHFDDITTAVNTLIKDEYIVHIAPEYSSIPLAAITGKGKLFFENGGYKDNETRLDKITTWAKNHTVISWCTIIIITLATISSIVQAVIQLLDFLTK